MRPLPVNSSLVSLSEPAPAPPPVRRPRRRPPPAWRWRSPPSPRRRPYQFIENNIFSCSIPTLARSCGSDTIVGSTTGCEDGSSSSLPSPSPAPKAVMGKGIQPNFILTLLILAGRAADGGRVVVMRRNTASRRCLLISGPVEHNDEDRDRGSPHSGPRGRRQRRCRARRATTMEPGQLLISVAAGAAPARWPRPRTRARGKAASPDLRAAEGAREAVCGGGGRSGRGLTRWWPREWSPCAAPTEKSGWAK
ncbi:hypothetical protein BRADI_1g50115v3 [Brachypodium distachyon]|uniref:Uncharacterized protein n=1 Tax=Brachypodium distachyon TaxID=15368 RepID=A0A2K2DQN9_BRADI|nr:hypothetical protein BRADI_1g50115v3 [Brachypodium distachyon]